ncbi:phosphoribosylanthranilate isomerase [Oscillatoria amoena NRMC-F 0135]|nr:phosphoribosylanthranilate isomerase [Oscillatoria amoena NRMC-F 0135]
MRDQESCMETGALHPDFMGFIFYRNSPRYVGDDFSVPESLPSCILKVGVFVNAEPDFIRGLVERNKLDAVQLHGDEPPEDCAAIRRFVPFVIKSFAVDQVFDFKVTVPYEPVVDYFLFDAKGQHFGGNGISFDWQVLERYRQRIPFFLSGGINAENILQVSRVGNPNLVGLDLNSGFEIRPGVKDVNTLRKALYLVNKMQHDHESI